MEQLISFIIRPPRAEYCPETDLLDDEFMLKGKWYQRKDIEILNCRGDKLLCSHYMPLLRPEEKALPCVIYCHGNSGCRTDASEAAIILLPSNISVFTLDFSGSGLSGGEHVTLGWNEKNDLKAVVEYLRADGNVSLIGLWGRSMGAVTSLMYGAEDPSIAGMVLDSPFSDLVDLMMELVDTYKVRLPKFTVKLAIQYMRKAIQKKAKFDITDLNTIKVAKSCFVPVLIGHAVDDDFIHPHHSDRIYEAYMGDKNIIKFEGDHNSPRPQFYFDSINIFFHNVLQPPDDELGGPYIDYMGGYMGKGSHSSMHELGYGPGPLASSTESGTGSTEEAIRQLRSKRPMTRIEVPSDNSPKTKHSDGQEEGKSDDHNPSSSNMISFELSGGNPYGPHVPAIIDDDDYVEYSLDSLSDFPSNIQEEEKMLMEAIMMSLQDQDIGHPEAEEPQSTRGINTSESLEREKGAISSTERDGLMRDDSAAPAISDRSTASDEHASNTSLSSKKPLVDSTPIAVEMGNTRAFAENGVSTSAHSSSANGGSDADVSSNTKATLTVERTPSGNIMDGLRKWDFNFFRNRR